MAHEHTCTFMYLHIYICVYVYTYIYMRICIYIQWMRWKDSCNILRVFIHISDSIYIYIQDSFHTGRILSYIQVSTDILSVDQQFQVSFAKEPYKRDSFAKQPYKRDAVLQKRPTNIYKRDLQIYIGLLGQLFIDQQSGCVGRILAK